MNVFCAVIGLLHESLHFHIFCKSHGSLKKLQRKHGSRGAFFRAKNEQRINGSTIPLLIPQIEEGYFNEIEKKNSTYYFKENEINKPL